MDLRQFFHRFTQPLANPEAVGDYWQDALTSPPREYGVPFLQNARNAVGGAVAGGLEGVANMTDPATLISLALSGGTAPQGATLGRMGMQSLRTLAGYGVDALDVASNVDQYGINPMTLLAIAGGAAGAKRGGPSVMGMDAYHGTTATRYVPGERQPGSDSARLELAQLAERHSIRDPMDVASIFERWKGSGQASQFGVTDAEVAAARKLTTEARGSTAAGRSVPSFDKFDVPDTNELGIHVGTREQASVVGDAFPVEVDLKTPLRLPDLGVWSPERVIDATRRAGVEITGREAQGVLGGKNPAAGMRGLLMEKGYDGIVYENASEGAGDSFILFESKQVHWKGE